MPMWNGTMFVRLIKLGCLELWKERTCDEYLRRSGWTTFKNGAIWTCRPTARKRSSLANNRTNGIGHQRALSTWIIKSAGQVKKCAVLQKLKTH